MRKIVFVSHDPLTPSIEQNFFLEAYRKDGVEVAYWCIRMLTDYSRERKLMNEITPEYYTEVTSKQQLRGLIEKEEKSTFFCIELWFNWNTLSIFDLFKYRKGFLFAIDWYGNIPRASAQTKFFSYLRTFNFVQLFGAAYRKVSLLLFKLVSKARSIQRPNLLFAAGMKSKEIFNWAEVVPLNHHDLSKHSNADLPADENYAVFLDSMLTNHPDLLRMKKTSIDRTAYFRKMNALFNYIESVKGMKVIIASHPKASCSEEFQGRQLVKGKTNELVRNSALVIVHQSTSLFYAVLDRKPILLAYTDEFIGKQSAKSFLKEIYHSILMYRDLLGCSLVNTDKLEEIQWENVDNKKYDAFIRNYITTDDPDSNYEIVKKTLMKREKQLAAEKLRHQ
jgi:hypothetical protein